jgi:hypothetical protein
LQDSISKKIPSQKRAGGVAEGVGPEFKSQYCGKKEMRWAEEEDIRKG